MSLDHNYIATLISNETGLDFQANSGIDNEGQHWIALTPKDASSQHAFVIKTLIKWRRISVVFEPGKFAGPLIEEMSRADASAKAVFICVLKDCVNNGSEVILRVNGKEITYDDPSLWDETWAKLELAIKRGNVELGTDEGIPDNAIVQEWTSRFVAAIFSLLPVEDTQSLEMEGYAEGAVKTFLVNRYERDSRNRSAAVAIHGSRCRACGLSFEEVYGPLAAGFIEIHHTTPISKLGDEYVIDPENDLLPLCSNCHSVIHRRTPPYTLAELQKFLKDK